MEIHEEKGQGEEEQEEAASMRVSFSGFFLLKKSNILKEETYMLKISCECYDIGYYMRL